MKKSFYFALALTAGLFASCSSDDLTAEAPQGQVTIDDSERVPIVIGVTNGATASLTRGTGTVGTSEKFNDGTNTSGSYFFGQEFQLFMFNKGTLTPGSSDGTEAGVVYCDSTFTTNAAGNGSTEMKVNGAAFQAYYPAAGSFDFWAYRLDDAKAGDPTGVATYAASTWTDNADEVKVPFIIDGSQDIMIGTSNAATAATTLAADPAVAAAAAKEVPAVTAAEFAKSKIFSAYSARRNVNPSMNFKHLLTRLHFAVKPSVAKISKTDNTWTLGTDIPAAPVGFNGFRVDSIWVYSKSEGDLIAAYKTTSDYAPGNAKAGINIEWTKATESWSDYTTLKPMYLKEHSEGVTTPEKGDFQDNGNFYLKANAAGDAIEVVFTGTINVDNTNTRTIKATDKIYGSEAKNSVTGKPTNCIGTLQNEIDAAIAALTAYWDAAAQGGNDNGVLDAAEIAAAVAAGTAGQGLPTDPAAQNYKTYYVKTDIVTSGALDVTVPLQDLTGQTLEWAAAGAFYWKLATKAQYTAAAVKEQYPATELDFKKAIETKTTAGLPDATDVADATKKAILVYKDIDGVAGFDAAGDMVLGYLIAAQAAATTGEGVARPIGEALLVAPSTDTDGYTVKIKYSRYRKEGSVIKWATETQTSYIKQANDFQPGKSHLVTITLNPDSTPAVETTDEGYDESDEFEIND